MWCVWCVGPCLSVYSFMLFVSCQAWCVCWTVFCLCTHILVCAFPLLIYSVFCLSFFLFSYFFFFVTKRLLLLSKKQFHPLLPLTSLFLTKYFIPTLMTICFLYSICFFYILTPSLSLSLTRPTSLPLFLPLPLPPPTSGVRGVRE